MLYYVEDRGEQISAVEQHDSGWVACPHRCGAETHEHGVGDEPVSHRVAHCRPVRGGYFLLRPIASLLGVIKWWKGSERVTEPHTGPLGGTGFSPEGCGFSGPGLLGEVI